MWLRYYCPKTYVNNAYIEMINEVRSRLRIGLVNIVIGVKSYSFIHSILYRLRCRAKKDEFSEMSRQHIFNRYLT